jgi:alpha-ketoglutaric semialdehyde dehydrogenase
MSTATNDTPTLFAGGWDRADDNEWLAVLNPADLRRVVARVPALSAAEIDRTYDVAERGAKAWRSTDPLSRGEVLVAASRLLRERSEQIVRDLVAEMGKTAAEATVEVRKAGDFFEYYGSMARSASGYALNDARPGTNTGVRFEPVGIVLAITPWNDPLLTPARKLAPALFAGNSVLLKPATETPLVSLHLARALVDAGLPPEVLSVVTGRGRDVSSHLLNDPRLSAVTFTGSNEVGMGILESLRHRNVRIQTEMGGKNATAVLADADLDLAAQTLVSAAFAQAGQRCTATSRLIVDRTVAGELLERVSQRVSALKVGPGDDPLTTMGPVVNAEQQKSVLAHVAQAIEDGASLVTGGGAPSDSQLEHGSFVQPTVLSDVTSTMPIWREEVFGPVLCMVEVNGFDEACEAVNDSSFGLASALFTTNLRSANLFIERAETGQVAINLPTAGWDVHHPFGGFRESGSPFKEQGTEALHFYTRTKTYAVRYV